MLAKEYNNIIITPYSELLDKPSGLSTHRGGPIWPDWDHSIMRHKRQDKYEDEIPILTTSDSYIETIDRPMYWCGPIVTHYGHMVAEFSSRIAMYNVENSDFLFCFAVHPRDNINSIEQAPIFFQEMLKWFRIPKERIFIVNKPIKAKTLVAVPEQEQLNEKPTEKLLNRLDFLTKLNGFDFKNKKGSYYVSKAGFPRGKIAGESYLEHIFGLSGIKIIRPESLSLNEQLRIYTSAKNLYFSEGSALHTLQLTGRKIENIFVLNRRENAITAKKSIEARARKVIYVNIGMSLDGITKNGSRAQYYGITIPYKERLFDLFGNKINMSYFSDELFLSCIKEDIRIWLHWLRERNSTNHINFNEFEEEVYIILSEFLKK